MRPLDMYPDSFGSHRGCVFPHAGPASYDPVVESSPGGVPVSGGDIVEAVEAGLKLFEWIGFSMSDDGAYRIEPIPLSVSGDPSNPNVQGIPTRTFALRWVDVATGNEVAAEVDLSTQVVRLFALGPK